MITFQRNTEGTQPINCFFFFSFFYQHNSAKNFCADACQAIPPIISCLWACSLSTTEVTVHGPSNPPPNLSISVIPQLPSPPPRAEDPRLEKYVNNFSFTKQFDKTRACRREVLTDGFADRWFADKDEHKTDDRPGDSCHYVFPRTLIRHAKLHTFQQWAADYWVVVISGVDPWGSVNLYPIRPQNMEECTKPAKEIWWSCLWQRELALRTNTKWLVSIRRWGFLTCELPFTSAFQ